MPRVRVPVTERIRGLVQPALPGFEDPKGKVAVVTFRKGKMYLHLEEARGIIENGETNGEGGG